MAILYSMAVLCMKASISVSASLEPLTVLSERSHRPRCQPGAVSLQGKVQRLPDCMLLASNVGSPLFRVPVRVLVRALGENSKAGKVRSVSNYHRIQYTYPLL